MGEVPEWLLFDQQQVHDTLVATSKHKPHLIADMAAMANVPGLAQGQARASVVHQAHHFASQVWHSSSSFLPLYSEESIHIAGLVTVALYSL